MNTFEGRRIIVVVLGLAIAFLASGCGTLTIETDPDPVEAQVDMTPSAPALSEPDVVEPTPTLTTEEVDEAVTETIVSKASEITEEATDAPLAELQEYTNTEYGFSLNYPTNWSLAEVNDEDFVGPGSRSVQLSQGTVILVIGYRRAGEQAPIGGSGTSAGEFEIRGTVQVAGQEVERSVIVYEGKDKAVMYDQSGVQSDGQPGAPIATGGLEFAPRMNDFAQIDYGQIELSKAVQEDADMIVSSLTIIEAEGDADKTTSAANYDYTGWQSYANETLGYSLMYPGQADVMGADRDKSVEFVGPIVGDDHWPWFSIQHFVRQWLADSYIPYAPLDEEMTIGGLPAVHYAVEATPQAYGRDEYYVIDGDHLFQITLLHAGGNEDWSLYEQFLDSITFAERG
jgi:hypothetical protein